MRLDLSPSFIPVIVEVIDKKTIGTLINFNRFRKIVDIVSAVAWQFALHDYQKSRILTFINPQIDPLGAGYNTRQSIIAVGSGGTFGRGFGQSVQKFNYLPEPIGDSIFAVYAEEFGFAGSVLLLAVFLALLGT